MKIVENQTFFKKWCFCVKAHLESLSTSIENFNNEDYFKELESEVNKLFATQLHDYMEDDEGGFEMIANSVLLSWAEIQLVIEHYGDDEFLTVEKIGEYVLFELAITIIEGMTARRENIIDIKAV